MTSVHTTPTVGPRAVVPAALAGAAGWAAFGALLVAGNEAPVPLLAAVLLAVLGTSFAVAAMVRARPGRNNAGLVLAVISPALATAALTPVIAAVGPQVLGILGLVFAVELAALAMVARRRSTGHGRA
jgi:hypothetical protein